MTQFVARLTLTFDPKIVIEDNGSVIMKLSSPVKWATMDKAMKHSFNLNFNHWLWEAFKLRPNVVNGIYGDEDYINISLNLTALQAKSIFKNIKVEETNV